MNKLQLTNEQVQLLLQAQEEKIQQLSKELKDCEASYELEWAGKDVFRAYIEQLGKPAMVGFVKYVYSKYEKDDFTKGLLSYWHDEVMDISDIAESGDQFKPWSPDEKI